MRKKKVLGMMLSFTLAFGLALPATMAMPLESVVTASDSNADATNKSIMATDSDATVADSNAVATDSNTGATIRDLTATDSNTTVTDSNATEKVIEHIVTCANGCMGENCECVCHMPSLYERLMDTETIEEFEQIVESATEDELNALNAEEIAEIEAHIISIEPKPLPSIVLNNTIEDTVQSEIVYLTLSYTEVAPFGDPVVGKKE